MRLTWARERPEHVAHLIAVEAEHTWAVSQTDVEVESVGDQIVAALVRQGWDPPEEPPKPRTRTGYVGLCSIAFVPSETGCTERRCKLCLREIDQIDLRGDLCGDG